MNTELKKRGRPISGSTPTNKRLPEVRVSDKQLEAYKQAAKDSGSNFSQWVRDGLDVAVNKCGK